MTFEIKAIAEGRVCLQGDLNFSNTPQVEKLGCKIIDKNPALIFDLRQVTSSDNSCLALLTAWARYAKHQHKSISFTNITKQVLDLMRVSGLVDLLPIEK